MALVTTLALSLLLFTSTAYAASDGKKIFKTNCASCHFLDDKMSTGPGLAGISGRRPDKQWLFDWVKDNETFAKKNPDAMSLKNKYPGSMNVFAGVLSDEDIKAVVDYIYSEPGPEKKVTDGGGTTTQTGPVVEEKGINPVYLLLTIAAILLILINVLKSVKKNLQNARNRELGLPALPEYTFRQWCSHNKRTVAVVLIFFFAWGSKAAWDGMWDLGVYTGYKPDQPIKFSHKIHAGDNKIACEYCHSGVLKSKVAGVPSVNVCMNCHKGIESGPTTGTEEIAKIYEAAGFDASTKTYSKTPKPLVWNKVHVLPDFVFFSHQQHVVVGKQECVTCHGDLTKMDVAQQTVPLTMGWCVECHHKTEVPGLATDQKTGTAVNAYYEELHKNLKLKYRGKADSLLTVERMGGLECGKCHY
ncbi:MAG: c-type cytochrome [Bacteroidota bacterium]